MQPIKYLANWLAANADKDHYLFKAQDLRALFPSLSDSAFKSLLSRAAKVGLLTRVCRGIYFYKEKGSEDALLLYHVAALLRAESFNYISLESTLSNEGIISQIPPQRISIMSSGRSSIVSCGKYGVIEFVHTKQKPEDLIDELIYDEKYKMWCANIPLAIQDMKNTRRKSDLIDWDATDELI